uniref:Uncharacterized protein n=1 Tax=Amphimedon queenslandica TaxID=400682 RepID=A0A1X7UNV1_AMPQE
MMLLTTRQEERRAPTTFLKATERRFRSSGAILFLSSTNSFMNWTMSSYLSDCSASLALLKRTSASSDMLSYSL